jgi:hypothetical protein
VRPNLFVSGPIFMFYLAKKLDQGLATLLLIIWIVPTGPKARIALVNLPGLRTKTKT